LVSRQAKRAGQPAGRLTKSAGQPVSRLAKLIGQPIKSSRLPKWTGSLGDPFCQVDRPTG